MTAKGLRYYKSRWTKNSALFKPLAAIPTQAISRIEVLDSLITPGTIGLRQEQYRFEIVLKDDFLDLYLDPYYDLY